MSQHSRQQPEPQYSDSHPNTQSRHLHIPFPQQDLMTPGSMSRPTGPNQGQQPAQYPQHLPPPPQQHPGPYGPPPPEHYHHYPPHHHHPQPPPQHMNHGPQYAPAQQFQHSLPPPPPQGYVESRPSPGYFPSYPPPPPQHVNKGPRPSGSGPPPGRKENGIDTDSVNGVERVPRRDKKRKGVLALARDAAAKDRRVLVHANLAFALIFISSYQILQALCRIP